MKTCSVCGQTYSDRIDFCFSDGAVLTEVAAPDSDEVGSAIDAPMPRAMGGLLDARTPVPRSRRRSLFGSSSTPVPGVPNLQLAAEDAPPLPSGMDLPEPPQASQEVLAGSDFMPQPLAPLPVSEPPEVEPEAGQPQVPFVPTPPAEPTPKPEPRVEAPVTPEPEPKAATPIPSEPRTQAREEKSGIPMLWVGVIVGAVLIVFIAIVTVLALGGVGVFAVSSTGGGTADEIPDTPPVQVVEPVRPEPQPAPLPLEEPEVADTEDPAPAEAADTDDPDQQPDAEVSDTEEPVSEGDPEPDAPDESVSEPVSEPEPPTTEPEPAVAVVEEPADVSPWGAPDPGAAEEQLVSIRTNPPGARVLIDGTERGTSPLDITLEHGSYSVQLLLDGHQGKTESLRVAEGVDSLQVDLPVEAESGPVMVVFPERDGYSLEVDGKPVGTLPTRAILTAGTHEFTVRGDAGVFKVSREVVFGDGTPVINLAE